MPLLETDSADALHTVLQSMHNSYRYNRNLLALELSFVVMTLSVSPFGVLWEDRDVLPYAFPSKIDSCHLHYGLYGDSIAVGSSRIASMFPPFIG